MQFESYNRLKQSCMSIGRFIVFCINYDGPKDCNSCFGMQGQPAEKVMSHQFSHFSPLTWHLKAALQAILQDINLHSKSSINHGNTPLALGIFLCLAARSLALAH